MMLKPFYISTKIINEQQIIQAADEALHQMGKSENPELVAKLIRVFEKPQERWMYKGATTNKGGRYELQGQFIAIVDLKHNELVYLTSGDVFPVKDCEE